MADDDAMAFDFEEQLDAVEPVAGAPADNAKPQLALITAEDAEAAQPKEKNYRQTVCAFWLRGMCMKGDSCGFLHKFDPERMPVCRVWMKTGECKEIECPFKHSLEDVKECNMYKLGFCIYGPHCRYKHTKQPGPPPNPDDVEAAKPREFRDWRKIMADDKPHDAQQQHGRRQRDGNREQMLALPAPQQQQQQQNQQQQQHQQHHHQQQQNQQQAMLAVPGPPGMTGQQQQQNNPMQQQPGMPGNPVDMQQHMMAAGMGMMAPGMMPGMPGQTPMGAGFMGPPGGGYPMPGLPGMGGMPNQQAMMAAQAAMMMQQMGMGSGMMPPLAGPVGPPGMLPPGPPGRGPRPPRTGGMNGW